MANLGSIGYNKSFLYAAVGAPGITQDARLLKEPSIYSNIINGNVISGHVIQLGDFGKMPLVTIGSSEIITKSKGVACEPSLKTPVKC